MIQYGLFRIVKKKPIKIKLTFLKITIGHRVNISKKDFRSVLPFFYNNHVIKVENSVILFILIDKFFFKK